MKNLIYILPTNFEHEGIKIKVQGQVNYFKQQHNVKLHHLTIRKKVFL